MSVLVGGSGLTLCHWAKSGQRPCGLISFTATPSPTPLPRQRRGDTLNNDALAQAAADASAWPPFLVHESPLRAASGRRHVTGKCHHDVYIHATASNLWVGVEQHPNPSSTSHIRFSEMVKPYQFGGEDRRTETFQTIRDVIAGANYTLYALRPDGAVLFNRSLQTCGHAPNDWTPRIAISVTVPEARIAIRHGNVDSDTLGPTVCGNWLLPSHRPKFATVETGGW